MTYDIISFIYQSITSFLIIYFFRNMLTPKKIGFKWYLIDFLIFIVFIILHIILKELLIIKSIFFISFLFSYLHFGFNEPIGKKIFYLLFPLIVFSITENLVAVIVIKIFNLPINYFKINMIGFFTINIFCALIDYILFSTIIVIAKKNSFYVKSIDLFKLSIFPLSQFIILFFICISLVSDNKKVIMYLFIGALLICLISDIFLIQTIKRISEMSKTEIEHRYLIQQNNLQMQHYTTLKYQIESMHVLRHEINNHMQTIKILMDKNETEKAKNSVAALGEIYDQFLNTGYCENKIADAVLHNKISYAKDRDIDLDIRCAIPEEISVRDIDLMTIFCNVLDNAIEACENTMQSRSLSLHCGIKSGYLTIKCVNSKSNEYRIAGDDFVTTKEDKSNHGYGIKIVRQIIEQYDGTAVFEDKGDHFLTLINLKCTAGAVA